MGPGLQCAPAGGLAGRRALGAEGPHGIPAPSRPLSPCVPQILQEGAENAQRRIFIEAFVSTGRVDNITMVMGLHPKYLSSFWRTQYLLLCMDGPLPHHKRHYIAIMVRASRAGPGREGLFRARALSRGAPGRSVHATRVVGGQGPAGVTCLSVLSHRCVLPLLRRRPGTSAPTWWACTWASSCKPGGTRSGSRACTVPPRS